MAVPLPTKKRKHHRDDAGPSPKKSKKDRKHSHDDEFTLVHASLVVSIPPVFASNPAQGVEEMLDSMVMRYIPTLRGVVLTHSNLHFFDSTARIQGDSPFAVCNVGFDATVWSPRVGQRLSGKINLCSPDHVSLLVHHTFNVSIPRHHLPKDQWTFEYGPAENDPEYGAGTAALAEQAPAEGGDVEMRDAGERAPGLGDAASQEREEGELSSQEESTGRWVHALTGSPLGHESGIVEFTVIGMTIANQMLSLVGSIQPDPFAPEHIASAQDVDAPADDAPADDAVEVDEDEDESGSDLDVDVLPELERGAGRMAEEARRRESATAKPKSKPDAEKPEGKAEKKKRKKDGEAVEGEKKHKMEKGAEGGETKHRKGKGKDGDGEERKPKKKKRKED